MKGLSIKKSAYGRPKAKIGIVSRTSAVEARPDMARREGIDAIDPKPSLPELLPSLRFGHAL